ncbi:MAG: ABC transporter permease [Chitinophagales bacterium]
MRKTLLIISREYITRVRKRSFIVWTLLGPLFFIGIMLMPLLLANMGQEKKRILVKDESGFIDVLPDSAGIYFKFGYNTLPLEDLKASYPHLEGGFDALLYIPPISAEKPLGIKLYSNEQMSIVTRMYIESVVANKLEAVNLKNRNLSKQDILQLRPTVVIDDMVIGKDNSEQQGDAIMATAIAYLLGFLTYIVLLIYGSMVMRGVMEEKTNRIVEVMISSVKPFQLMIGKIIGIGAVGLTQFTIWGIVIFFLQLLMQFIFREQFAEMTQLSMAANETTEVDTLQMLNAVNSLQNINLFYILTVFILYFLGGYFLYASLFAALGSLVSDDDGDLQMYTFPLSMLIIISVFIAMAVIQQPQSQLAFWASLVPFSSPIVMPALLPFGVPFWQIILSVILLIIGFLFTTWIAARIYRTGILMYGKKPKLKEVIRWMLYKG